MSRSPRALLTLALLTTAAGLALAEEPEKKLGWADTAEFSFVATEGNSQSSSFGFKNVTTRTWEHALLTVRAQGVRVESEQGDRIAMDDGGGGFIIIDPDTAVSAENYALSGRYDRNISPRLFWFSGAGWERNEPSGIENRWIAEGGVGNIWRNDDEVKFKTNYGVTYTKQEDVNVNPAVDDTFAGLRAGWDYWNQLTKSTAFTNVLVLDENLDETSDWRAVLDNGLAVAISERLALKVGLLFAYDHEPSLETLRLFDTGGVDTGTTVTAPLDELDTTFTASLVVNFM